MRKAALLESPVLGFTLMKRCLDYLRAYDLPIDFQGQQNDYDLVITCSNLVSQKRASI